MELPDKNNYKLRKDAKLKRIIKLLKLSASLEDMEIMKSSIESILEMLEEEVDS